MVLTIVAALFAVGAGVIVLFGRTGLRPGADLWKHYGATVLMVAAVLVPAALGPAIFATVVALAAWRGVLELALLQNLRVVPAAHVAIALASLGAVWLGREANLLLAVSLPLLALAVPLYARAILRGLQGWWRWPCALVFPLAAAAYLSRIVYAEHGFLWICFVYGVVETQDSMAFLFGRLFGRRPLAPRLSPRKTIEGALAGAVAGSLVGVLIGVLMLTQRWPIAVALSLVVAAAGFCGDLFASALKRAASAKDFAPLHVRHGGVLDIYDSTMFAAIVFGPLLTLIC